MNVKKQAAKDAFEFARAQMFYGEGAGTRRKLIKAQVEHRIATLPGYALAYENAMLAQNMTNHAAKAAKERMRKDVSKKVERNVRGLSTGNKASLTTGVAVMATIGYYAHETGFDKVAYDYSKKQYKKGKAWAKKKRAELKLKKGI